MVGSLLKNKKENDHAAFGRPCKLSSVGGAPFAMLSEDVVVVEPQPSSDQQQTLPSRRSSGWAPLWSSSFSNQVAQREE